MGLQKRVQGKPFRSRQIQLLFLTREKIETLLIALVLILWMQISREFGVSLIASREFCTAESYLQETVGMRFSEREQDVDKNSEMKKWKDGGSWAGRHGKVKNTQEE